MRTLALLALLCCAHAAHAQVYADAEGTPGFGNLPLSSSLDSRNTDLARRIFRRAAGFVTFSQATAANTSGQVVYIRQLDSIGAPTVPAIVRDGFLSSVVAVDASATKYLVAGSSPTNQDGGRDAGVLRLNADFSFDTSFDGDGTTVLNVASNNYEDPLDVAVHPTNPRTYVAMFAATAASTNLGDLYLAQVGATGNDDYYLTVLDDVARASASIAFDPQGRLLLASGIDDGGCGVIVRRYLVPADGSGSAAMLDASFGANGTLRFDRFTGCEVVTGVRALPSGRILVSMYAVNALGQPFGGFIGVTPSGAIDLNFATETLNFRVLGFELQSTGRIIAFGYLNATTARIERLNAGGTLDPTFFFGSSYRNVIFATASEGLVDTQIGDLTVLADDKVVLFADVQRDSSATNRDLWVHRIYGTDRLFANGYE